MRTSVLAAALVLALAVPSAAFAPPFVASSGRATLPSFSTSALSSSQIDRLLSPLSSAPPARHSPLRTVSKAVATAADATSGLGFKLPLAGDTLLQIKGFTPDACKTLGQETNKLVTSFRNAAAAAKDKEGEEEGSVSAGKPAIQDVFEYSWKEGACSLSLECNPNLFPNAFSAKVYVCFQDDAVKVASQVNLPDLIDQIKDFKARSAAP
eukprot:CAMPEP_0174930500 /NCGR_PEP_ID=MMETSP1355-20121228/31197_1 /TAXON_ID=464990 /ORGANISM="Hemiselmis tepida, Strain CCMP443" /LENGTH=209 /DNA_ID=CAMNT_0016176799 /DNA_START=32 /DNA_END=661 /DNA_ORIENTATION=+